MENWALGLLGSLERKGTAHWKLYIAAVALGTVGAVLLNFRRRRFFWGGIVGWYAAFLVDRLVF